MLRQHLYIGIYLMGFLICTSCAKPVHEMTDGVSVNEVVLGKTSLESARKRSSKRCELIKHGNYSLELLCKDTGLSFYAKQDDPERKVMSIAVREPYAVPTSKGIVCGKNTFRNVVNAYGKTACKWSVAEPLICLQYNGIEFCADCNHFNVREGETVVTEININRETVAPESSQSGDPIDSLFEVKAEGDLRRVMVLSGFFRMTGTLQFQYGKDASFIDYSPFVTTLKNITWQEIQNPSAVFGTRFYLKGNLTKDKRLFVRYLERMAGKRAESTDVIIGVPPPKK